ncbi:carbamoyl phosphate synthetase, putative [Plasmodium knowlesi strain H]|uniref:carbamoyl-phosphate synthase (ammonia) n=3 Tax=Plasmodium knowlesi TaxID=5850 RepID=A0A5K1VNP6_PLAKH|nr:carbamoyl phosphate synthetase, putative [Plasmodium knowlesi strain H]OTN63641.1 putative Carbamoyl phosphate synthetase [Plasmodium knowlesi]CAA9990685.1 carbamoyl phosphate synthetase, putative [Plasmodium knowlesi strain H]SBO25925.1 carbamoyl phosphate synthetase, putative [Plasmodium knowlesi strain H]SBO28673.1 carbamoyl phosphate synthetase, putative [Plasmodium knowlesi strain H]VVS80159.1 carbamoyl phosphate synthetase, putative [Plasmodium knowlesi strain H]|eukprot:XP_002261975.1 carbamoyl phosphate synthetase, putative [Plasmodium knowlesi strain H]
MSTEFWPDYDYRTVGKLILEDDTEFVGYSVGYEGCKEDEKASSNREATKEINSNQVLEKKKYLKEDILFKNSKIENEDYIVTGEVIFNTAMVGYPEALTDPSYFGQILVLTFPSIGNYGVEKVHHDHFGLVTNFESNKIQIQGLVICEYTKHSYHYNSYITLSEWLKLYKVPCIGGIDTRALTKILREKGSMLGKIVIYKNAKNANKLYKEISLFNPGEIDTIKYVCNHFIRVIKLGKINYYNNGKSKEDSKGINDENNYSLNEVENGNSLTNVNDYNYHSLSSFEKIDFNKNSNQHSLLRDKMNLLTSSEENIDYYTGYREYSTNGGKKDAFFTLRGTCEYDKYLIDLEENSFFHDGNVDEYGHYDVEMSLQRSGLSGRNKHGFTQDEVTFNLNNDYSTYVKKKLNKEEFLNLVNKRKSDKEKIIVIVDCGIKNSIIKNLMKNGKDLPLTYIIVPYYYDYNSIDYDAVLLSNGPGDPKKCEFLIETLKKSLQKNKLIFGICLGNQLLGISLGCETYKMKYGNRGVNQPVIQLVDNKCYITSQNHGYCLKKKSILRRKDLAISYVNANDKSIEGISHKNGRFYSVQFHPEGNNGPEDTSFLFKNFLIDMFNKKREFREHIGHNIIYIKKKVLLLGSGGLCIGQAGEFDYSGTQAIKSLKECGIYVILVNPNIATVQTSKGLADKVYFLPVNCEFVEKIIKKEKPDFILCTFGGQTALNCALMLEQKKVLKKNNCLALGTSLESIMITENRSMFAEKLREINEIIAPYGSAKNVEQAIEVANKIGYPILVRTTFSLGGLNSSFINNEEELVKKCKEIFLQTDNEIFIDKSLKGWKEIEYELLRDNKNNCIAICNMENIDPLGIHTGDSIVVAPSQTLSNHEYYKFREIALKVITHLNIIGECNIQFGINPKTGEYCIIEVNARLSRSSALASKATGYPLAYISAKIALGYDLISLKNSITKKTTACFEPSLDYITTKIPRWDLNKFEFASNTMNSSMKSVGEVMSIGRTFEESIQKSLRCIDDNYLGFSNTYCIDWDEAKIVDELKNPSPKRIDAIHQAFHLNIPMEKIHELTNIEYWFLHKFYNIFNLQNKLKTLSLEQLSFYDMKYFKKHGFSDKQIAHYLSFNNPNVNEAVVMRYRESLGLHPHIKVIDTLSAEFPALTNYLYLTYQGVEHDVLPLNMKRKKKLPAEGNGKKVDRVENHVYPHNISPEMEENKSVKQLKMGCDQNVCNEMFGKDVDVTVVSTKVDGAVGKHKMVSSSPIGDSKMEGSSNDLLSKEVKQEKGIGSDETNIFSGKNCTNNISSSSGLNIAENTIMNNDPHSAQQGIGDNQHNKSSNANNTSKDGWNKKLQNREVLMNQRMDDISNRSSHSTNDQLYLENFNTSDEEMTNKNGDTSHYMSKKKKNFSDSKGAGNMYYLVDSVYNNEYKMSKMKELINSENTDSNDSFQCEQRGSVVKSGHVGTPFGATSGAEDSIAMHVPHYARSRTNAGKEEITKGENKLHHEGIEREKSKGKSSNKKRETKLNSNGINIDDKNSDCFSELSYLRNYTKSSNAENDNTDDDDAFYNGGDDVYTCSTDNGLFDDCGESYNTFSSKDSEGSSSIYSENENIFSEKFNDIGFKITHDRNEKEKEKKKCFIVLGCGCYRIGSSVEFDWSAIHCVKTIRKLNHKAILINCNPETVSTDYDESDRLYFDEITTEVIKFIYNFEKSHGVIIAFGGQTSNNLVFSLYKNSVNILGTSAKSVDCCENRNKFSNLCDSLKIDQPKWNKFTKLSKAIQFANEVKFPVLVRPSYVLSGAAMRVVNCFEELKNFLMKAAIVSKDNPVVISKFIENAKEIEIDCVSKNGKIINYAISEHVENAGVHSGDATLILPAQNIYVETHRKIKKISEKISKSLNISGPFNIQFICHQNEIKIIECNLRASRTFPFISKALNLNFIDLATRILMGYDVKPINISLIDLEYTAVKSPIFSFNRLHGSDCILGVEMKSTGEVACFGLNKYEALLKSLIATGMKLPKKSILISIKNLNNKLAFEEPFQLLFLMGFTIYATEGTYDFYSKFLESFNVTKGSKFHQRLIRVHNKSSENLMPNITDLIMNHKVEMVINITDTLKTKVSSNGYKIRRLASDFQVPLITNMKLSSLFIDSLYRKFSRRKEKKPFYTIKSYDEYISLV